jgi:hypothetical protein
MYELVVGWSKGVPRRPLGGGVFTVTAVSYHGWGEEGVGYGAAGALAVEEFECRIGGSGW